MQRKTFSRVEIKNTDQGQIEAVFSTFDVVDKDGDYTLKSAFTDGHPVVISAYNHGSWEGKLPVGKGVVRVRGNQAVLEGQFFMNTTAGRDTFETVKELGDLQEYSYGFHITDSEPGTVEGKSVRVIKGVDVHEVSPVLVGAGVGTRTLSVKGAKDNDGDGSGRVNTNSELKRAVRGAIPTHQTDTLTKGWDGAKTAAGLPEDARPSELRSVYAWVDPDGDPECKSSYRFPHHHGVAGPANLRACLQHIAVLNGTDPGVPDADRKSVYDHLAAHLLDADREPPELRTAEATKSKRFNDEAAAVMAAVAGLVDRATEVMALRSAKGKGMSPAAADLLSWVRDEVKRLNTLLETPVEENTPEQPDSDEIASTVLAAIARSQGL